MTLKLKHLHKEFVRKQIMEQLENRFLLGLMSMNLDSLLILLQTGQSEVRIIQNKSCAISPLFLLNGVETNFGWIEFPSACGAYIIKKPGSENFPVIYEADTNRTFLAKIPFEYCYTNGSLMHASRIVNSDECMVLRTRATTNEAGRVVDCNYAKITGPMSILKVLSFESLIFNPRPNDPNLEFDVRYNQSSYRGGCYP